MAPRTLNGSILRDDADVADFDDNVLIFYVNGKRIEESAVDPRTTLACYLRDHCEFFGLLFSLAFYVFSEINWYKNRMQ
jgi:hypothetical protein